MTCTRILLTALLFAFLLAGTGCGTSGSATQIGEQRYSATEPENVLVYFSEESIDQAFELIGRVTAEKTASWTFTNVDEDKIVNRLKKEAASIGADAIVIGSMEDGSVPWAVQGAGGSSSLNKKSAVAFAIKFK